jgi:hypothetical protein
MGVIAGGCPMHEKIIRLTSSSIWARNLAHESVVLFATIGYWQNSLSKVEERI